MRILDFGNTSVTVELEPADCFLLAEACAALITSESSTARILLGDALAAAFTAAGMAAAAEFHLGRPAREGDYSLEEVRTSWLPRDDRATVPQA